MLSLCLRCTAELPVNAVGRNCMLHSLLDVLDFLWRSISCLVFPPDLPLNTMPDSETDLLIRPATRLELYLFMTTIGCFCGFLIPQLRFCCLFFPTTHQLGPRPIMHWLASRFICGLLVPEYATFYIQGIIVLLLPLNLDLTTSCGFSLPPTPTNACPDHCPFGATAHP